MKRLILPLLLGTLALATPARAQSIAGEWDATMQTPGGPRSLKLLVQETDGKLTGTVKRPAGDVPLTGSIKGKEVTISWTIDYNGNALTLTVTGTVEGDSLKGTVDFGGVAQDEFTATRTPPAKPPADPAAWDGSHSS